MKPLRGKGVQIFLLVVGTSAFALAEEKTSKQQKDEVAAKKYREKEPPFQPPPIPVQRSLQVDSGAEHPPSFFQSLQQQPQKIEARQLDAPQPAQKIEARQFDVPQQLEPQQQFQQNSFNAFQEQPGRDQFQNRQQQQSFDQVPQFNPLPQQQQQQQQQHQQQQFQQQQQPQNFQFPQAQQQQSFQDPNNFQSRQQETLPTLPPVFIPPNSPVGPPPQLQSPIRNLFREPEPPFSLSGIFQRFLRLFNINN